MKLLIQKRIHSLRDFIIISTDTVEQRIARAEIYALEDYLNGMCLKSMLLQCEKMEYYCACQGIKNAINFTDKNESNKSKPNDPINPS